MIDSRMEDLVARKIKSRYQVQSLIGRGGMAEVYKVWDEVRADTLAMKVLREDLAQDKIFLRRFEREAQTLAKLQHRSIVRFYGLERDDLLVFLLMDYIEGTSLREEIFRANSPFFVGKVLEVLRPVCAAMHYAHQMGIVHCDLKPGNILIDRHGEHLVTDFGIARMVDAATSTMVGIGTPAYMAPELIMGQDPTSQTDVYALGVILYEMLTGGERPFTGERAETTGTTAEKIRWEQLKLAPNPLKQFNQKLSNEIVVIILRCLEKLPARRYDDIQAVYTELYSIAGEEEITRASTEVKMNESISQVYIDKERLWINKAMESAEALQDYRMDYRKKKNHSNVEQSGKDLSFLTHLQTQQDPINDFDIQKNKIVISSEKYITVQDLVSRELYKNIIVNGFYDQVRFFPLDEMILVRMLDDISLIKVVDGKVVRKLENTTVYSIRGFEISSDGVYCVALLDKDLILCWDLKDSTGQERFRGFVYSINSVHTKIVPKKDLLILVTDLDVFKILSLPSLEVINSVSVNDFSGVKDVACSPQGKFFAIWNNRTFLQIRKVNDPENTISVENLTSPIITVAFLPDEKSLLTVDKEGVISLLEVQTLNVIRQQASGMEGIDKVLISGDGRDMVTLCKGQRLDYWKINYQG